MKILKDNERFLDSVAIEVAKKYIEMKPPMSPADNVRIATIAYKQALAMLDVKLNLEAVLNRTPFLVSQRVEHKNKTENDPKD